MVICQNLYVEIKVSHLKLARNIRAYTFFEFMRQRLSQMVPHPILQQQLNKYSSSLQICSQCGVLAAFSSIFWVIGYLGFSILWVVIGKYTYFFYYMRPHSASNTVYMIGAHSALPNK